MCMQAGECWGLALHIGAFNWGWPVSACRLICADSARCRTNWIWEIDKGIVNEYDDLGGPSPIYLWLAWAIGAMAGYSVMAGAAWWGPAGDGVADMSSSWRINLSACSNQPACPQRAAPGQGGPHVLRAVTAWLESWDSSTITVLPLEPVCWSLYLELMSKSSMPWLCRTFGNVWAFVIQHHHTSKKPLWTNFSETHQSDPKSSYVRHYTLHDIFNLIHFGSEEGWLIFVLGSWFSLRELDVVPDLVMSGALQHIDHIHVDWTRYCVQSNESWMLLSDPSQIIGNPCH